MERLPSRNFNSSPYLSSVSINPLELLKIAARACALLGFTLETSTSFCNLNSFILSPARFLIISGCYFSVMGLPISMFVDKLNNLGYTV